MTDEYETRPPLPTQWVYLADECGAIDGYLLTPLGRDSGCDLTLTAVRGGYGGDGNPADAVLAVWRGDDLALVTLDPVGQVYGRDISADDLAVIGAFFRETRPALLDHWTGRTSSLGLLRALRVPG